MKWQVTAVEYLTDYKLLITFRNGSRKLIDLESYLKGDVFEPLKDLEYFKTVKVHPELDTIYWDNGADFAPEFLFENGIEKLAA